MIPVPTNCEKLIFREPFAHKCGRKYHIRAVIGEGPEFNVEIKNQQHIQTIQSLICQDRKLLNATVKIENGHMTVVEHSPQTDFFEEEHGGRDC